jgi:site-specific DNA-methyltransferase (adenine-specific)
VTPYLSEPDVTLYLGDSLSVLQGLPDESVDLILTDPPYSSGGLHRSDRTGQSTRSKYVQTGTLIQRPDFQGDHRDQRSYLAWCSIWLSECLRIVKPGRAALVFTDWRQLPITSDALQAGGFVWRGVIPWNKGRGVRPNLGWSAQAEYLVWGSRGPLDLGHLVYLDGAIDAAIRLDEKHHMTGKPLGLIEQLLQVCPAGGTVLDPFAGSGTTLVAARRRGLRAIGVEISEEYCAVAESRLRQLSLLGEAV